jgi:hypothetical protein
MIQLHIDPWLIFINLFAIIGIWHAAQFEASYGYWAKTDKSQWRYQDGEILGRIHCFFALRGRDKYISNLPHPYWLKPLFSCVMCMPSIWGTAGYWLFQPSPNIFSWVVYIVALAGLARILKGGFL